MKKKLFIFNIIVFIVFYSNTLSSQPSVVNVKELILEIPTVNTKNYENIKNTLASIDGVTLKAYCDNYKFFLLTYDTTKVESGESIVQLINNSYQNVKAEFKLGVTISQFINECSRFPVQSNNKAK